MIIEKNRCKVLEAAHPPDLAWISPVVSLHLESCKKKQLSDNFLRKKQVGVRCLTKVSQGISSFVAFTSCNGFILG